MAKLKQLTHEELAAAAPIDVVDAINTGVTIVGATLPFLKDLFAKISEWAKSIQSDALSTPKGKRKAIEELQKVTEARNTVQKEQNKIYDAWFEEIRTTGKLS